MAWQIKPNSGNFEFFADLVGTRESFSPTFSGDRPNPRVPGNGFSLYILRRPFSLTFYKPVFASRQTFANGRTPGKTRYIKTWSQNISSVRARFWNSDALVFCLFFFSFSFIVTTGGWLMTNDDALLLGVGAEETFCTSEITARRCFWMPNDDHTYFQRSALKTTKLSQKFSDEELRRDARRRVPAL